ncbi:hypothetical protein HRI_003800300 [Hibiscus trionum]|uniref:Retrotransposon gag domain-containing protein n=1 Tax=Hibiscus trionum TaxID=183268 RepID=A0A9W7IS58_HIBTR|nr:hypothetical protein HRI_003800300 [Hibiscus trionum]
MKQYFHATSIKDDADKVNMASVYLTDFSLLWWRRRCSEEKEQGYSHWAQEKLHKLKHEGSILEYVRWFTKLKLQVTDMTEAEGLFAFKNWLKRWAKMELKRMRVEELSKVMVAYESIAKFEIIESTKPRGKGYGGGVKNVEVLKCFTCGGNHMKSDCPMNNHLNVVQGDVTEESKDEVMRLGAIVSVNKLRESPGATTSVKVAEPRSKPSVISDDKAVKTMVEKTQMECHRCKGPHRVHACPHRVKPSKVVDKPEQSEATRLGSMILNSAKAKGRKQKGLMFFDINVAGRPRNVLVDIGATDLFMSKKAAEKLGLRVDSSTGKIKTANTKEVPIVGETRKVELQIGE